MARTYKSVVVVVLVTYPGNRLAAILRVFRPAALITHLRPLSSSPQSISRICDKAQGRRTKCSIGSYIGSCSLDCRGQAKIIKDVVYDAALLVASSEALPVATQAAGVLLRR